MPLVHQLCYAHGLHLAVCDFLYKSLPFEDPGKILINNDVDPIDTSDDCEQTFNVIVEEETEREVTDKFELSAIVKKVRASVLHFKHSPTKIDTILAKHLPSDGNNKTYSLILDVTTRWSSTFSMLERFEKVHEGLRAALLETKSDIYFPASDIVVVSRLTKLLKYVSTTMKCICKRDTTLMNVDNYITTLLKKVIDESEMGAELALKIANRINERRTVASAAMQFLQHAGEKTRPPGTKYAGEDMLHLMIKDYTQDEINTFLHAMYKRLGQDKLEFPIHDSTNDNEKEKDLSVTEVSVTEVSVHEDSFENECNEFNAEQCKDVEPMSSPNLEEEIFQFVLTKKKGPILEKLQNWTSTIQATSVEPERRFSAAGRMHTKINSRMGDRAINALSIIYPRFKEVELAEHAQRKENKKISGERAEKQKAAESVELDKHAQGKKGNKISGAQAEKRKAVHGGAKKSKRAK